MPKLLRKFLGLTLLMTTVGLATCQSMVRQANGGEIVPAGIEKLQLDDIC